MIQQNLQLHSYALMAARPTPCRQVPAVTPVQSHLALSFINLDKQPASHTNTADSNHIHTTTQTVCRTAVSEDDCLER